MTILVNVTQLPKIIMKTLKTGHGIPHKLARERPEQFEWSSCFSCSCCCCSSFSSFVFSFFLFFLFLFLFFFFFFFFSYFSSTNLIETSRTLVLFYLEIFKQNNNYTHSKCPHSVSTYGTFAARL